MTCIHGCTTQATATDSHSCGTLDWLPWPAPMAMAPRTGDCHSTGHGTRGFPGPTGCPFPSLPSPERPAAAADGQGAGAGTGSLPGAGPGQRWVHRGRRVPPGTARLVPQAPNGGSVLQRQVRRTPAPGCGWHRHLLQGLGMPMGAPSPDASAASAALPRPWAPPSPPLPPLAVQSEGTKRSLPTPSPQHQPRRAHVGEQPCQQRQRQEPGEDPASRGA